MPDESFLVTALPHSASPASPFHVSLFIAPRLEPAGDDAQLSDFAGMRRWTAAVAEAQITLYGHRSGQQPAPLRTSRVGHLRPDLWSTVFPDELPVRAWTTPDLTAKPWRTFPAHRMDSHALGLHESAITASPVLAPRPSQLGFGRELFAALGIGDFFGKYRGPGSWIPQGGRGALTHLDDLVGRGQTGAARDPKDSLLNVLLDRQAEWAEQSAKRLDSLEPGVVHGGNGPSTGAWSVDKTLADTHAARRYFQRPEDAYGYEPRPVDGQRPPDGPELPAAEFHQRLGLIGDLSPLLRSLGLIIDLVVDDLSEIVGLTSLSAQVAVAELDNPVSEQPRTRCRVQGAHFTVVSDSGRWDGGMLRLGDEELFTLLQLDPDAEALKLEQYLHTVPGLLALEDNGNAGTSAAPPALRSTGFAIAEQHRATALHDRVADAPVKAAAILQGTAPPLDLEQVTRGLRLEVWDDVTGKWLSLHRRLLDVTVDGTPVLQRAPDEGFLQGASLTSSDTHPDPPTMYAHEVLAGWDGWSLAAPRPEKPVVHHDGDEVLPEDLPQQPVGDEPVSVSSAVDPGTLPSLRYGRRYAFRARAVDLAGNSPGLPGTVDPAAPPAAPTPGALAQAKRRLHAITPSASGRAPRRSATNPDESRGGPTLRSILDGLPEDQRRLVAPLMAFVDQPVALRADRREAVEQAFRQAVERAPHVIGNSTAQTPAEVFAQALDATANDPRGLLDLGLSQTEAVAAAADLVTAPRPFLRWAPLIEPAVVPRHAYTWGESLLRVVIRSDVAPDGTLTGPAEYAAQHPELEWRATSERHLAPPKTSLVEAELHSKLDEAIGTEGPGSAHVRKRWLGLALRESGTFLQPAVADPDNPGKTLPVSGLSFHLGESATPLPDPDTGTVVVPTPETLRRGDPLVPGQYAAHDVGTLTVPYLPDPAATGLSLVFPDADPALRRAETAACHLGVQSLTLRYSGSWPMLDSYRLVLQAGDQLDGAVEGNALQISVPPGEQLRVRLSSATDPDLLALFGLWRTLHGSISGTPQIAEAAADGWLWWLTPAAEMTLVHAVPRPVEAPQVLHLGVTRDENQTTATLAALVRVHAPSTERVDVEAHWAEPHDDLSKAGPELVDAQAVACSADVHPDRQLVMLHGVGFPAPISDGYHHFGDTRHRVVSYTIRATTRYREFFPSSVAAGKEQLSRVSAVHRVVVRNTARPAKIAVRDVLPLFLWSDQTQVAQPFGVRRTRRAGVRIYLDRPWFSTGEGELLGVVLGSGDDGDRPVSRWAADPIWQPGNGPELSTDLPLVRSAQLLGGEPAAQPVTALTTVQTSSQDGEPVAVLGYQPEYNADRGLWFVDVSLAPGAAFWPFLRLAVARFQPESIDGCHLGPVVQCDFAQLPPERSLVVARTNEGNVKVAVSGAASAPAGLRVPSSRRKPTPAERLDPWRTLRVRLERRVPEVGTDLGWEVLSVGVLPVLSQTDGIVTWEGTVALEDPVDVPARPGRGQTGDLRVVVEEEERLPADPSPAGQPRTSSRIVYSDEVIL